MRAAAVIACLAAPAGAEVPQVVLRALLTDAPRADQFAEDFLQEVSLLQLIPVLAGIRGTIGAVEDVTALGNDRYTVTTATHRLDATLVLDADGRVIGLWFQPPEPTDLSLSEALDALAALPGTVSWRIERDGVLLAEAGGDAPVHVASAFKLGVLAALAGRDPAEVVVLEDRHKSLPSGQLQDFATPAPMTLHTAATAMIAISDNTATDLLIDVVGADTVAGILGIDHLLTTRQFFVLKADADLRALYRTDPQAAMAEADTRPLPPVSSVTGITHAEGLGWAVPLSTLCRLVGEVADHPAMAPNPGPRHPGDWARAAFKGGSEPGVLAFVHHLTAADGTARCAAVAIASDAPIDEAAALSAWRGVLAALARETL